MKDAQSLPVLRVVFYRSENGSEPVRDWLLELKKEDRKVIGEDIKTAQFGWPLGMPLIRKLGKGLWEVRSKLNKGIARTIFTVQDDTMILIHGFIKKSMSIPKNEMRTSLDRLKNL